MAKKFDINSMFDAIKSGLDSGSKSTNSFDYSNFLKLEVGKTYKVRLLPFVGDPANTFYHITEFGWDSKATDQYVSAVSPSSVGEPCPIKAAWAKGYDRNSNTNTSGIRKREQWLVNVYVIDDPTNPENNGTVKILKYGKQLNTVIAEAFTDEFKDDLGGAIYDLSADGFTLNIKVEKQQDYPNYASSFFSRKPSAIPGVSEDDEKMTEIYESAFDLKSIMPIKSYDALKKMLDEHYYISNNVSQTVINEEAEEQELEVVTPVVKKTKTVEEPKSSTTTSDAELDDLIANL